jgi:PPE-repeat protein
VLDFGRLPPEINSGRMYSGPGPESLLDAAAAWDGLGTELRSAGASYGSVVSGLTAGSWQGPASSSMADAAAPYVAWMNNTAAQAEESANNARAAVVAYETAFTAMVPPPAIEANRTQLMALVATNFFGQNSPAIAATEGQYGEMWAQDAAAMYGYAGASSAASAVTPFTPPPQTTSPVGLAAQGTAVSRAAGTAASTLTSQPTIAAITVPQALGQLSSVSVVSAADPSFTGPLAPFLTLISNTYNGFPFGYPIGTATGGSPAGALGLGFSSGNMNALRQILQAYFGVGLANFGYGIGQQAYQGPLGTTAGVAGAWIPYTPYQWFGGLGGGLGGVHATAAVGHAGTIGRLSVPASWAAAAPHAVTQPAGGPGLLSVHGAAANPDNSGLLRGIPLTGTGAGRRGSGGLIYRYGFRYAVMPRPPSGG